MSFFFLTFSVVVTSFSKYESDNFFEMKLSNSINQYKKFKKINYIDSRHKGNQNKIHFFHILKLILNEPSLDYSIKLDLKYVRIFFDATTFDRITKDRAAKFVDMLSAIGGTMGLLTGFSLISGVEILYFAIKIVLNVLKKRQ